MSPILLAVLIVGAVALALGLILAVASVLLAVPVNERAERLRAALPGANCGGCGFSGCDAYAQAVEKGEAPPNLCTPGGAEAAAAMAAIVGGDATVVPKRAVVRCGGCDETAVTHAGYSGVRTCAEGAKLYGGAKGCVFGCLGLGDCVAVCEFSAIAVEHGLARVNAAICAGCGTCVAACPKSLITLVPKESATMNVHCLSTEKGAAVRKVCQSGCIGCMKCQKVCPSGAVSVTDSLATIDPEKCSGCGLCAAECPVKCIAL